MRIILEVCKEHGKYYLDSKTTNNSVVKEIATEINISILENNHFFDDIYTREHVIKQAELLLEKIFDVDQLIAIGHVGVSGTIVYDMLSKYIPFYKRVATLVTLSDLIPEYQLLK